MLAWNPITQFLRERALTLAAPHRKYAPTGDKTLLYRKRRFAWKLRYSRPEVTSEVTRRKLASAVCKAGRHPGTPVPASARAAGFCEALDGGKSKSPRRRAAIRQVTL